MYYTKDEKRKEIIINLIKDADKAYDAGDIISYNDYREAAHSLTEENEMFTCKHGQYIGRWGD